MTTDDGSFRYRRHFAVLIGLTVLLTVANRWLPVHGPLARFGMYGALPWAVGPPVILAICAGLGAASYAVLVGIVWKAELSPLAVVSMTVCCMLAALGVLALHLALLADGLWVAVSRWFAFSLGLWYHDGLKRSATVAGRQRPCLNT